MSDETNRELARGYFEAFRTRDEAWWQAHIAADFVRHDPGLDFEVKGLAGIHKLAELMHGGFSDVELAIDDTVAEGDKVLVRLRQIGTHTGEFQGVAPTGRRTEIEVMDLFRIEGGKLVEHWALMDNLSMLKQLGAVDA